MLRVFGPALQNDADRNDHVRFLLQGQFANDNRDFECAWDLMEGDDGRRRNRTQLVEV